MQGVQEVWQLMFHRIEILKIADYLKVRLHNKMKHLSLSFSDNSILSEMNTTAIEMNTTAIRNLNQATRCHEGMEIWAQDLSEATYTYRTHVHK